MILLRYQFLSQIGPIHTNQAGSASIDVDYIHINVLLGYLEHLLIDVLCNSDTVDEKSKHGILMAVNKYFWIQNDFLTMHYLSSWKQDSKANQTPTKKSKYCCL